MFNAYYILYCKVIPTALYGIPIIRFLWDKGLWAYHSKVHCSVYEMQRVTMNSECVPRCL